MKIGEPRREIYVEPIEVPEPLRETPQNVPAKAEPEPEMEPVEDE